jgi:hypothetical protein
VGFAVRSGFCVSWWLLRLVVAFVVGRQWLLQSIGSGFCSP